METAKTWVKGEKSPYQLHDITHFPDWGGLIVMDAFFNNLAAALMICIGVVWACGATLMSGIMPLALTCALVLLIVDLGILVSDLGDSARFIHSLRVMRLTSPLSVGVWGLSCYGCFLGLATVASWAYAFGPAPDSLAGYIVAAIMRLGIIMAIIAAVVVMCYKGVVFSCSSQPGLCQARWLTPFMVSDSLLMALSLLGCLVIFFSPVEGVRVAFVLPTLVLLGARSITFALLWQDVKYRARLVYKHEENRWAGIWVYGIGGIAPLILIFLGNPGFILAVATLLATGIFERKWIIELAKPV